MAARGMTPEPGSEPDSDPPPALEPAKFAALVSEATDDQLEQGLAANRDVVLAEIFRAMPQRLRRDKVGGLDVAIDWVIGGRSDGGSDRYQVVIADGECSVARDGGRKPAVTFTVGAVDFVKLVSGNVSGPQRSCSASSRSAET
jgi:hypothetical protein